MKALILATLVVFLLLGTLQLGYGKQQAPLQQIQSKLAHAAVDMLSVIAQAAKHKRSLARPSRQIEVGSCNALEVLNILRDYPQECLTALLAINFDAIITGTLTAFIDLIAGFCNEECGQPLVDLLFACGIPDGGAIIVYACRLNEIGMTCGNILLDIFITRRAAEDACLPQSMPCSSACQTALQSSRDTAGCCGNLTDVGSNFGINAEIDGFALWESCGVSVAEPCTGGPLNSGKILVVTKVAFIWLAILALVVVLL